MTTATAASAEAPALDFVGVMHEGIPVSLKNVDACIKFYVDVLGLKLLPRPKALDDLGPGAWLTDRHDRVQFHIIGTDRDYRPGADAPISPTGRHTAWMVANLDAFRARLGALGVHYDEVKGLIGSGSAQLFIKDPEGHTWEFQEAPRPR
jgi:catechol 2,3-dioxygenase-like lactoylglutathione lyase family enzyme